MIDVSDFLASNPVRINLAHKDPVVPTKAETTGEGEGDNSCFDGGSESSKSKQSSEQEAYLHKGSYGHLSVDNGTNDKRYGKRRYKRTPKKGGFGSRNHRTGDSGLIDPYDEQSCKESGLTLLDAAARPRQALAERLQAKGYAPAVVERVLVRLEELGFIDDQAYAQSYLRYCLSKNLGESGVFREMKRKGVEASTAERVIASAVNEGLFVESAYELGRKVAKKTMGLDENVRRRRLWSAGVRKGHSPALIKQVAADLFPWASSD